MLRLGDMTPKQFLRRHWQKSPRLIARGFPRFENFIDRRRAIALACAHDVESRLVLRNRRQWRVEHGPFKRSDFNELPEKNWTLLVHGVNFHLKEADRLLREFSFIPFWRLDDVMASYAAPGGGVGPHFDSYDVFLLQGIGARRWRIGRLRDSGLTPNAPLKLLKNFTADREHVVEQGDVLYLPPGFAHDGTAIDECVTYSIGFRAPAAQEFGVEFLSDLQDKLALKGSYHDPAPSFQRAPAKISDQAFSEAARLIEGIKWRRRDIAQSFGRYMSEPKPHIFFTPPAAPLSAKQFNARLHANGVSLDLKTRMLYHRDSVFINGECARGNGRLFELANERVLQAGARFDLETRALLYSWYLAGYLHPHDDAHVGAQRT